MSRQQPKRKGVPSPEELAAYVDGELDPATQAQVEVWLAEHPEAAAQLQEDTRLLQLWHSARPDEPSRATWAALLARVQTVLALSVNHGLQRAVTRRRHRQLWRVAGVIGTAAAVLVTLILSQGRLTEKRVAPESSEILAMASSDDVEIISIDGADVHTLVVGHPPLREPLVLASAGDVKLENIEPDVDGMVPQVRLANGPSPPMIVAPLEPDPDKDP